ncbi:NEAT domain-containing protein [Pseudogracilibacillus sp. ICA-222130]|uniref:NEAT domain-containing protein n=1 Tax=Pseudogracilibacillus sp. ICA-222130 TaxID=3134655 RepID=UPI0030BA3E98
MLKRNVITLVMAFVAIFLVFAPTNTLQVSANSQEVSYQILEAGSDSSSVADGYFLKPAKLTIEDGKTYLEFSLKDADYVKSLSGPYGAVKVISDEGNKRVVKMQVGDITKPIELQMHVVVPEEVAGQPYDHEHKARMIVDAEGIDLAGLTTNDQGEETTTTSDDGDKKDENPKTGDTTPLMMYTVLLIASFGIIVILWTRRSVSE